MSLSDLTPDLQNLLGTYLHPVTSSMKLKDWVPNPFQDGNFEAFIDDIANAIWETPLLADDVNQLYHQRGAYDPTNYLHFRENIYGTFLEHLCENPHAVPLIEFMLDRSPEWINELRRPETLYANPHASSLIVRILKYVERRQPEKPIYWNLVEKEIWSFMSSNPAVIHLLIENLHRINWSKFSLNPLAVPILEKHPERIDWKQLSSNPNAVDLLRKNPERIHWRSLCRNPSADAMNLLREHPERIHWYSLSGNQSPGAIQLLEEHPDRIVWEIASYNSLAMPLFKRFHQELTPDRYIMFSNTSPEAIEFMRMRSGTFPFAFLTQNPGAIDYIEQQFRVLSREDILCSLLTLYQNPAIFTPE